MRHWAAAAAVTGGRWLHPCLLACLQALPPLDHHHPPLSRVAMNGDKAPIPAEPATGPSHWDDVEANRKDVSSCLARQDGTATLSWSKLVVTVKDVKVGAYCLCGMMGGVSRCTWDTNHT